MLIHRVHTKWNTSHTLFPYKRSLQTIDPSSFTRLGWFSLSAIDQYSSLLPPVGVWSVSQYQCGGPSSHEPLSIVGLVGRYPANCLMERMPIYQRWIFSKYPHAGPLLHAVLVRLSPGYPPLIGKLHTRYSPVRRSPAGIATPAALDLHVLSLPLAFILSQDQTLRCLNCFYILAPESVIVVQSHTSLTVSIRKINFPNTCTTCWIM